MDLKGVFSSKAALVAGLVCGVAGAAFLPALPVVGSLGMGAITGLSGAQITHTLENLG